MAQPPSSPRGRRGGVQTMFVALDTQKCDKLCGFPEDKNSNRRKVLINL